MRTWVPSVNQAKGVWILCSPLKLQHQLQNLCFIGQYQSFWSHPTYILFATFQHASYPRPHQVADSWVHEWKTPCSPFSVPASHGCCLINHLRGLLGPESDHKLQAEEATTAFTGKTGNGLPGRSAASTGEKTPQKLESQGPQRHWDLPVCLHLKDLISSHSTPGDTSPDLWSNVPVKSIC